MKAYQFCSGIKALSIGVVAWAYIFGTAFVANTGAAPSGLTSVIALQRPDGSPSDSARGTVTVRETASSQSFSVDVRNIIPTANTPVGGLGVYLSQLPFGTNNFYFVNVLNGSTNGHWRLNLNGSSTPPQLGVSDVTNLFGRVVLIADATTNVYLETIIVPLVSSPAAVSYKIRVDLSRPADAPSPDATGQLTVKLDGLRGTSLIDLHTKRLSIGNSYWMWVHGSNAPTPTLPASSNLLSRTARFLGDTSKGQQLLDGALSNGVVRVDQLSGATVEVLDAFGAVHLQGQVP